MVSASDTYCYRLCRFAREKHAKEGELADGKFSLTAHTAMGEKEYEYFFDPDDMKYYLKADHSDEGTAITIENGVITEQTKDHLMVYELTDELI